MHPITALPLAFYRRLSVSVAMARSNATRYRLREMDFASANHILHIIVLQVADGAGLNDNNIGARFVETGNVTMRVALEVNFALWGIIFCATVETARQFALF